MDANELATNGTGLFVMAGGAIWMLRWIVRTFHIDTLAIKSNTAEVNVIDRLESEITRLEKIIEKQQIDIASMVKAQANLEKQITNQKAVLMAIEFIIETTCSCDAESKSRVAALIRELVDSSEKT